VFCLLVLSCILCAGLWPFHSPLNNVRWLDSEDGLRFGPNGIVLSTHEFRDRRPPDATGHSLEIWLTPARVSEDKTILAFDSSPNPRAPFSLAQYGTSLVIRRYLVDEHGNVTQPFFKIDHVFDAGKRKLVTITSNKDGIEVYVDGVLAGTSWDGGILYRELTGRLVLANSTVDDSWLGEIARVAIYDRELTSAEVTEHFHSWTSDQVKSRIDDESMVALYRFDERGGNTVHNLANPATDLTIPAKYVVVHPGFLRATWKQFSPRSSAWKKWSFWKALGTNIVGFMPVGFVLFAYLSDVKVIGRPALTAILLGLVLSFTVEALQRLLPTRDSGLTDLFTNTLGTALGVWLHRSLIVRFWWAKILKLGVSTAETRTTSLIGEDSTAARS
jgi:VanZ family protein